MLAPSGLCLRRLKGHLTQQGGDGADMHMQHAQNMQQVTNQSFLQTDRCPTDRCSKFASRPCIALAVSHLS